MTKIHACDACGKGFERANGARRHCSDECRFWSKVDASGGPDACWPWTGSRNSDGYGLFCFRGRTIGAGRAMAAIHAKPLSAKALHHCDNPPCCNPLHMYEGTDADNARDRTLRGRGGGPKIAGAAHYSRRMPDRLPRGDRNGMRRHPESVQRGTAQPQSRLTDALVRWIRAQVGRLSEVRMAAALGVSRTTVRRVTSGRGWKHVSSEA